MKWRRPTWAFNTPLEQLPKIYVGMSVAFVNPPLRRNLAWYDRFWRWLNGQMFGNGYVRSINYVTGSVIVVWK